MSPSSARVPARRLLLSALGVGMLGTLLAWAGLAARPVFPVGAVILGFAVLAVWRFASRWTAVLAAIASLLVFSRLLGGEGADQLLGDEGVVVAIGRALQGIGTLAAVATGAWIGVRRTRAKSDPPARRPCLRRAGAGVGTDLLYYPLVGETSAERKYAHNVVMLLIVAAAGAHAIRQARGRHRVRPDSAMADEY